MALFHNLGVKLRSCLCDVPGYASAQPLVFLDVVENILFLNRKLMAAPIYQKPIYGWEPGQEMPRWHTCRYN